MAPRLSTRASHPRANREKYTFSRLHRSTRERLRRRFGRGVSVDRAINALLDFESANAGRSTRLTPPARRTRENAPEGLSEPRRVGRLRPELPDPNGFVRRDRTSVRIPVVVYPDAAH
ncbi:MAG: hypothetical protein KGJ23_13845 [Euryarchaeota archaeon]|nr:hypothetical protein [Euryarchaeota archaeon]MDE1882045.1 hypothetical protein [Euryarchaeota archaeon]MDE2045990.1 hypothetical protein [Thermoplasmata archaeon]